VYTRTEPRPDVGLLTSDLPALAGVPVAVPLVKVASIGVALISTSGNLTLLISGYDLKCPELSRFDTCRALIIQ
jgi:hypothetical protein